MNLSDLPYRNPIPFANAAGPGYIRTIPVGAATPTPTDAPASYTEGFPPITFTPVSGGGIPPSGADMNDILFVVSSWTRWVACGGAAVYDAGYAAAVGGYPNLSVLASTTPGIFWQSTADGNTTDPDGGSPANWIPVAPLKATPSDYQVGTDNAKFLTPYAMAQGMGGSADVFYWPNGVIEQWGYIAYSSATEPTVLVSLSASYTSTSYQVQLTPAINSPSNRMDTWLQVINGLKSTNLFYVQYQHAPAGNPGLDGFYWRTTGR